MQIDPFKFMAEQKAFFDGLKRDLAEAVGFFSIEFAELEACLDNTIHELLSLEPDTGTALTSAIRNLSTRLDILESLARELEIADEHRKPLQTAIEKTIGLSSYRNWLLHDRWTGSGVLLAGDGPKTPQHSKQRMRKSGKTYKWQTEQFTVEAIKSRTDECKAIVQSLVPMLRFYQGIRSAKKEGNQAE
jgi:hypothetical protein